MVCVDYDQAACGLDLDVGLADHSLCIGAFGLDLLPALGADAAGNATDEAASSRAAPKYVFNRMRILTFSFCFVKLQNYFDIHSIK